MINYNEILSECTFKTSRSSGAGGQHVNKVETRVTIIYNLEKSNVLDNNQKELIKKKLSNILTKNCTLQLSSQRFKSQIKNKTDVEIKLVELIKKALKLEKTRKKTKVSKGAKLKRLADKKIISEKKKNRSKPQIKNDDY